MIDVVEECQVELMMFPCSRSHAGVSGSSGLEEASISQLDDGGGLCGRQTATPEVPGLQVGAPDEIFFEAVVLEPFTFVVQPTDLFSGGGTVSSGEFFDFAELSVAQYQITDLG